jgi:GWxTD domain-containing protein
LSVKKFPVYILFLITVLFFVTCRSKNSYTSRPAKSIDNPDSDLLEVNAVAFHKNDSVTSVFLEIKNENVLYKRPDTSSVFYAQLRISYQLLFEHNSRKILDSSTFYIFDQAGVENVKLKSLYSDFELPAKMGNPYFLEVLVFDVNRRVRYKRGLNIYKQDRLGEQNFLVKKHDTIAFKNNFFKNEKVNFYYTEPTAQTIYVDCFLKDFGPALPPFSTRPADELKYKPDSTFVLERARDHFTVQMPEQGFYHLKADSGNLAGLTLHTFDEYFPGVGTSEEMIHCARYIMSREEYETCRDAPDKKAAIDKFWLGIAGSNERARELLKRYYGRVKEANKYYTSYAEGWKSDRGMIFIVFGPPGNVYHSKKDEVWVYGNEANPATLRFVFNKTSNPFSDNDFIMERSQFYKDPWHTAVDFWRQGRVYLDGR